MAAVPAPNSRTPLLAAHHSSRHHQPSSGSSSHTSPASRQSRSTSPHAYASRSRPPNPSNSSFIRRRTRRRSPQIQFVPGLIALGLLAFVGFLAWDVSSAGNCYFQALCNVLGEGERMDTVWWENSGAYAPWRSGGSGGGKRGLPRGCEINQVTLVSLALRDGARMEVRESLTPAAPPCGEISHDECGREHEARAEEDQG